MIYTLENAALKVLVNDAGAELWSLWDKQLGRECLWHGDPDVWPRRSPLLFPICGKLADNRPLPAGAQEPLKQHGFIRDCVHSLVAQTADSLHMRACASNESRTRYPFDFQLDVVYTLEGNQLRQSCTVTNAGAVEMPFSIGFHTGFSYPLESGKSHDSCKIIFEKPETIYRHATADGLLSGEKSLYLDGEREVAVDPDEFTKSVVMKDPASRYVGIVDSDTGREIRLWAEGFPYLLFWSMPGRTPFICIEPWHGICDPADINTPFREKPGIILLGAGEEFNCAQTIEIIGGNA